MFNWTQQTILYLSYSARTALTNARGINHATPAFNLLRPQLTADSGRHHTSNNRRTRITTVRPNKPYDKQEKITDCCFNHRHTIFNNCCHQNNWHDRLVLTKAAYEALEMTKNQPSNIQTKNQTEKVILNRAESKAQNHPTANQDSSRKKRVVSRRNNLAINST